MKRTILTANSKASIKQKLMTTGVLALAMVFGANVALGLAVSAADIPQTDWDAINGTWEDWKQELPCPQSGGGTTGISVRDGTSLQNQKEAFLYFIARGLTPTQSAGFVGNLIAESGVMPDTQEKNPIGGGRGGYGIAQWTGGRRIAIEKFAPNEAALKTLQFQLDYLWEQEMEKEPRFISIVKDFNANKAMSLREASDIILLRFESPLEKGPSVQEARAALGQKVLDLFGKDVGTATTDTSSVTCAELSFGSIAGDGSFPLKTTKKEMEQHNGRCFQSGQMCQGGHPYAAHDILADTGTPVISMYAGKLTNIGNDKCGGRLLGIYSAAEGIILTYMHLSNAKTMGLKIGATIQKGQQIGIVGSVREGCGGVAHLHLDAALGNDRPGCRRENCPVANQAIFQAGSDKIGLPKLLYNGYMKLP